MVTMELKFITPPVPTRSGRWAVAYGSVPKDEDLYDERGYIRLRFIESVRVFKRKINAEKYKARVSQKHWQECLYENMKAQGRLN